MADRRNLNNPIETRTEESDKSEINPIALPYVRMSELRFLPDCAGIYFAIEESGKVVYIGQSINIRQRWRAHHVQGDLCDLSDLHSARRVRVAWLPVEKDELDQLEIKLIRRFKPRLNVSHIPVEPKPKLKAVMVRLIIREVAEQKGIDNPFALSQATGINYANCHKMWQGQQKMINVETVDKLCKALKVRPGQLFEYEIE